MTQANIPLILLLGVFALVGCKEQARAPSVGGNEAMEMSLPSERREVVAIDNEALADDFAEAEGEDDYTAWQRAAGFIRAPQYNNFSRDELERRSRAGDMFASQKLGELAWETYSDRNAAIDWLKKSAEQGSVAAISQAAMLFDPDSDVLMLKRRQGIEIQGSRIDAYFWARLGVLRGDPDAVFGVEKQMKYLAPRQITEMDLLAMEQYQILQNAYKKQYGHGFINVFPDDADAPHNQLISLRK